MGRDDEWLTPPRWELAAESIAIKIRWVGVLIGYLSVSLGPPDSHRPILNAILTLGAGYTLLDTISSIRGRVFLGRYPLLIGAMEALFIGLLCHFHAGLDSPFRYYYFLSLIVCAIRYTARETLLTCLMHSASTVGLYWSLAMERRDLGTLVLMLVVLGWVTWAASAMARLLKRFGEHLSHLNAALRENQTLLEKRIDERTLELQEAQARLLHQEKMAAFGLLAAGIAHEVGNPLTSISAVVQLLRKRDLDEYARERLGLVDGQLQRIRTTLQELVEFSRPASRERTRFTLTGIIDEARNIAKYYKGTNSRVITADVSSELPALFGIRDQLVQVFLNLILNAIDATAKGGRIEIRAKYAGDRLKITVKDDGCGIEANLQDQLFRPYFTTKKHGTGLGLFVTRKLVEDHHGTITFESQAGKGTTFELSLPVA
jgi:signal transduction histidine kinase